VNDFTILPFASAHALVHLNAALNALATVLLVVGFVKIKRGRVVAHARLMMATFLVSCLFLVSYLIYHYQVGSVNFTHPGAVRYVYLTILATHVVLAAAVPFLALLTIVFALLGTGRLRKEQLPAVSKIKFLARHRRLARWTFPIWLYVSVTGVVVYVMLYHLWPPAAG
jgi:putative membrane protein